jgi:DedD protein
MKIRFEPAVIELPASQAMGFVRAGMAVEVKDEPEPEVKPAAKPEEIKGEPEVKDEQPKPEPEKKDEKPEVKATPKRTDKPKR